MVIDDEFRFNYETAYTVYSRNYDAWSSLSDKAKRRARRQTENAVREAGFNGVDTGLISVNAWATIINEKNGVTPTKQTRVAKEHPVTHKNIALHCLEYSSKLEFDQYFDIWFDNLITTYTTNEENQRLRNFQSKYSFGVDCWKQMYENAGIKLMERPKLNTKAAKIQHGVKI